MGAFLALSVWFALVTVVPGLVTLAVLWGAVQVVIAPSTDVVSASGLADATVALAVAVTLMLLTQWAGVLVEEKVLVPRRWLGYPDKDDPAVREVAPGIDPLGMTYFTMDPYREYEGLYLLLAEFRDDDDPHGHLERAITQFFMTVNVGVAFASGILVAVVLAAVERETSAVVRAAGYSAGLAVAVLMTWRVAISRFELMGWSLAAARRRRVNTAQNHPQAGPQTDPGGSPR